MQESYFKRESVNYLGYCIDTQGLHPLEEQFCCTCNCTCCKELQYILFDILLKQLIFMKHDLAATLPRPCMFRFNSLLRDVIFMKHVLTATLHVSIQFVTQRCQLRLPSSNCNKLTATRCTTSETVVARLSARTFLKGLCSREPANLCA